MCKSYELAIFSASGTNKDKEMVKVSGFYLTGAISYGSSNLYNWMCVEDPFSQIQSQNGVSNRRNKLRYYQDRDKYQATIQCMKGN